MTVLCTYCSAEKDRSPGQLPAVERYQSHRLKSVYAAATSLGLEFLILSGRYGILNPSDSIPYYDHLLQPSEVNEHAKRVADQLQALGVQDLVFFTKSLPDDDPAKSYYDCIELASQRAGIEFKHILLPAYDA